MKNDNDKITFIEQLLFSIKNHITKIILKRFCKKLVAWLYVLVDIIVFVAADIFLFHLSILVQTDRDLSPNNLRSILA